MPETLYDRIIGRLKNRRGLVYIAVAASVIVGASQLLTGLSGIAGLFYTDASHLTVECTLRPYYLITGFTDSPRALERVSGPADNVQQIARRVAADIAAAAQGNPPDSTELVIRGGSLKATRPVELYVNLSPLAAHIQLSRRRENVGVSDSLDLTGLSRDELYFDYDRNRLAIAVRDPSGWSSSEFVEVFKTANGFSFDTQEPVTRKAIGFRPRLVRLLIDGVEGVGQGGTSPEASASQVETALRDSLGIQDGLLISPLSMVDLKETADRIRALPLGEGKEGLVDQHGVDFVVSTKVLVEKKKTFRWF